MSPFIGLFCLVIGFVGVGLLQIFARDLMWELTHWNNQVAGRASERTEAWEAGQVVSGVVMIVFGGIIACWGLSVNGENNARDARATAVVETSEANQLNQVRALDDTFSQAILTLQTQATTESRRVRASELGLDVERGVEVEYGFCDQDETFYAYILYYSLESFSNDNTAYVYLPERATPDDCEPPDWNVYSARELGESRLGGYWYRVDAYMGLGAPPTSTPIRATRTPNQSTTPTPIRATQTPAPSPTP